VPHIASDHQRPVDEDLLGFCLADPVSCPILRGVTFIPLKPLDLREELRDE
jgi:hypothetical protein